MVSVESILDKIPKRLFLKNDFFFPDRFFEKKCIFYDLKFFMFKIEADNGATVDIFHAFFLFFLPSFLNRQVD